LSRAEIAGLDLKAREILARKEKTVVIPDTEDEGVLVGLAGESRGGTSITLTIRSPEQSQQQPLVRGPLAVRPLYLPAVPCRAVGAPSFYSALKAHLGSG
jgi:hypothetical protein